MHNNSLEQFTSEHINLLNEAVLMAEDIVSNHYKVSHSQWQKMRYDIKTLADLTDDEIVIGPFAQVIRYTARHKARMLPTSAFDFYKICLQDHNIIQVLQQYHELKLFPFSLFVVTHELVHVVRFCKFLQAYNASFKERLAEEKRVHLFTRSILEPVNIQGLTDVLKFADNWHNAIDCLA